VPVADEAGKRRIFTYMVDDFNQPHNPARIIQPTYVEDWMAGSPLRKIIFAEWSDGDRPGAHLRAEAGEAAAVVAAAGLRAVGARHVTLLPND